MELNNNHSNSNIGGKEGKFASFFRKVFTPEAEGNINEVSALFENLDYADVINNKEFYELGQKDGVVGTKQEDIDFYATSCAQQLQHLSFPQLRGSEKLFEERILSLSNQKNEIEKEVNELNNYYVHYSMNCKCFLGSTSKFVAFVYILTAFLILVADGFISYQLASTIFDLQGDDQAFTITISIGLTLLTVIVKICYDYFMNVSDGMARIRFKKIAELTGDKNNYRVILGISFKAFFMVIAFSAVTLVFIFLALSRYDATVLDGDSKLGVNAKYLFLLMNIFMPIVSGICFSLGQKTFQLTKTMKELEKNIMFRKEGLSVISGDLVRAEAQRAIISTTLNDWILKPAFIDQLRDGYVLSYTQGYKSGYNEPDWHEPVAELIYKVEKMRNKMFVRSRNTLLNT